MAYSNTDEAIGPPVGGSFNGDNHTALRAFKWDVSGNVGKPLMPTDQMYSGVSTADGKAFFAATPGAIVKINAVVVVGQTITAGNLYQVNTAGRINATTGTAFRALQGATNSGGVGDEFYDILVEIWKPKG